MIYSGLTVTAAGLALLARAQAGDTQLTISRVSVGNGTSGTAASAMTAMVNKITDYTITSVTCSANTVEIKCKMQSVGTSYYLREFALFIKDSTNTETLYAYAAESTGAEYIDTASSSVIEREITIRLTITNAASVVSAWNSAIYVTVNPETGKIPADKLPVMNYEPLGTVAAHNTSASAHADLRKLIRKATVGNTYEHVMTGGSLLR